MYPKNSLKHVGFHWQIKKNVSSLDKAHVEYREIEFWNTVNALVKSGIRFCHPNTIFSLYKSILVPKLTYGLELCHINKTTMDKLNRCGKTALKQLFDVSKYSINILEYIAGLPTIEGIITSKKLNMVKSIIENSSTRNTLLYLLTCKQENDVRELCSFISKITSIFDYLINPKRFLVVGEPRNNAQEEIANLVMDCFANWPIFEKRKEFKMLMGVRRYKKMFNLFILIFLKIITRCTLTGV